MKYTKRMPNFNTQTGELKIEQFYTKYAREYYNQNILSILNTSINTSGDG